jgi:hypothetical protein
LSYRALRAGISPGLFLASLVITPNLPCSGLRPETPAAVRPLESEFVMVNGRSGSDTRKRTVVVHTRCLPEEADALKAKAEDAGISLSMFIRCAGLSRRIRNQSDRIICADIKTFAAQLRSLGGLQKNLFNSSRGAYSQQTSELLIAFKNAVDEATRALKRIAPDVEEVDSDDR